jgi:hypothetical protein
MPELTGVVILPLGAPLPPNTTLLCCNNCQLGLDEANAVPNECQPGMWWRCLLCEQQQQRKPEPERTDEGGTITIAGVEEGLERLANELQATRYELQRRRP